MNRERLVATSIAVLVLAAVVVVATFVFTGGEGGGPELEARTVDAQLPRPELSPEVTPSSGSRLEVVTAEPQTTTPGEPASYRDALGKIVGRVVEESLAPIPGIVVSALSVSASALLPDSGSPFELSDLFGDFEGPSERTTEDGRFELEGLDPRGRPLTRFRPGRIACEFPHPRRRAGSRRGRGSR